MGCTPIELYSAMCSYARQNPSQSISDGLKRFREQHGLDLEPIGCKGFNKLIELTRFENARL